MKRIIAAVLLSLTVCAAASCGAKAQTDYLSYQKSGLYIDAVFTVNGDSFPATVELEAPEFDSDGRMLARSARLTLGGNSIISGVSFEFEGGTAYVVSGVLKIPVDDDELLAGITDILSLFCISPESFYEASETKLDGADCIRAIYSEGASEDAGGNRVEVCIGESGLPLRIEAILGEKTVTADIANIEIR